MRTSDVEDLASEGARAWASSNDPESLLALFTDDCIFEDVKYFSHLGHLLGLSFWDGELAKLANFPLEVC